MPTVVAAWTKVIVDYAAVHGLDVGRELDLARPDARVPAHVDDAVWASAAAELGDPDVGVHIAERAIGAGSFGVVGYLVRASTSIGHALAQMAHFHRLIKDGGRLEVSWSPTGATVIAMPEPERGPWPREIAELIAANYVKLGREWTGVDLAPREVTFQHARPRDTSELERFFQCRLRFGQPTNSVVLDREVVELPFLTAEPTLATYLASFAGAQLDELTQTSVVDEVRRAIAEELATTRSIAIGPIARRLATTPRSLQRRLGAEGWSFRALVDAVRQKLAVELLQRGAPAQDIADRLGFSEPRAFRRAFRRWTGQAPSALKRAS